MNDDQQDWNFPFEEPLHEVFPQLHAAQNAWMAQLDSLEAPDRKTHELIRMVVTVGLRNPAGVQRHAQLALGTAGPELTSVVFEARQDSEGRIGHRGSLQGLGE